MSRENVEVVRWRGADSGPSKRGEFTEMLGFLDPNIEVIPPKEAPGLARVYHGHEGFLELLSQWFEPWDEYSIELEDLIDAGDRVITVERHVGRRKETGVVEVAQPVSAIWTIKGGAAVGIRIFLDKREALEAAGLRE